MPRRCHQSVIHFTPPLTGAGARATNAPIMYRILAPGRYYSHLILARSDLVGLAFCCKLHLRKEITRHAAATTLRIQKNFMGASTASLIAFRSIDGVPSFLGLTASTMKSSFDCRTNETATFCLRDSNHFQVY